MATASCWRCAQALLVVLTAACGGRTESDALPQEGKHQEGAGGSMIAGSGGGGTDEPMSQGGETSAGGEPSAPGGSAGTSNEPGVSECTPVGGAFASEVLSFSFGGGQNHNQAQFPQAVFGPPEAGDVLSVVSLGDGGAVVLGFGEHEIADGPGPDFVVFENPFPGFAELATVSVSDDLITWFAFPCTAALEDADYGECAGVGQVFSRSDNGIDPLDPSVAGGDWFDLGVLGLESVRFVKIEDRADISGTQGVFDLDAVGARYINCSPPLDE